LIFVRTIGCPRVRTCAPLPRLAQPKGFAPHALLASPPARGL